MTLEDILTATARISLEEETHTYTVDGELAATSVSALIEQLFPFDQLAMAARAGRTSRERWTGDPECSDEALAAAWTAHGAARAAEGTAVHAAIHAFLATQPGCVGGALPPADPIPLDPVWAEALSFDFAGWTFAPEVPIAANFPGVGLVAGTVDLLAMSPDGEFHLFDWKNIPAIKFDARGTREQLSGLEVEGTKRVRYSVQLALYARILSATHAITVPPEHRHIVSVVADERPTEIELSEDGDGLAALLLV